jgi:hypothetical protein
MAHIKPGRRGWRTGPERWRHGGGLAGVPLSSSPGHDFTGFLGQNDLGVDGVLTRGETQWGTAPRWLATVASLL